LNLLLTVATKTMRAIVLFAAAVGCTEAAKLQQSPVSRVVALITELKSKIEADGRKEQQSYDKYACWCESTLARKANSISEAKDTIDKLQKQIEKLKGDLGAHSAEIDQLKKDIAANLEAQKEAAEVRNKENSEFESGKNENEQCTGALEAAIKVLTGAGGKRGFLETMQETQLLSVVDGVRFVLKQESAVSSLSDKDLDVVKRFIANPETFVGSRAGVMSAAQIAANPFGDYAPQSTQIQGILKGMYDAFTADIEKDNAEEAEKQKSFEELMATKKQESQETLETTLQKQEHDSLHKTKELADSKMHQDDIRAQLKTDDEEFFEATKEGVEYFDLHDVHDVQWSLCLLSKWLNQGCKVKAGEWAERSRL